MQSASLADRQLAPLLVDLPVTVRGSRSAIAMNSLVRPAVGEQRFRSAHRFEIAKEAAGSDGVQLPLIITILDCGQLIIFTAAVARGYDSPVARQARRNHARQLRKRHDRLSV